MKKRSSAVVNLLAVCTAITLVMVCVFLYLFVTNATGIKEKQASLAQMDAFFQQEITDGFVNSVAQEAIEAAKVKEEETVVEGQVFTAPEGFQIISTSAEWDVEKMELLYEELLQNKHGEELEYLSNIEILPEEDEKVTGYHTMEMGFSAITMNYPALPDDLTITFSRLSGSISLYGGDVNTEVADMALVLSHEYGHHYTFYYMFDEDSISNSEYAELRGVPEDKIYQPGPTGADYMNQHHWTLCEIAANDYVTLMGSPTTRQIMECYDVKQILNGKPETDYSLQNSCINISPQENLMLPLAYEISGLSDYYYSFIDEAAPTVSEKKEINLSVEVVSKGYDLVGGYRTFKGYKIKWDMPYEQDGAVYTLICYDPENYNEFKLPIKTVHSGEEGSAMVGTVVAEHSTSISYAFDGIDSGKKTFVVSVVLPDGTMYLSNRLEYDFD